MLEENSTAEFRVQPKNFTDAELLAFLEEKADLEELRSQADAVRRQVYGDAVFVRGLIEFTNYCRNDCFYCGIRAGNKNAQRYRLTKEQILTCCNQGYALGYRTFVLQGGEDMSYTDNDISQIVAAIKSDFPDCAVTLSIGERVRHSYQQFYDSGADRFLLRHETANPQHYSRLHPENMSQENRKRCLFDLKEIGFQVGAGFMVGSPFQTNQNIIEDLRFMQELQPDMIGIGPFVTHCDTPFAGYENGSVKKTLILLSIIRLMFPYVLLPATTALGTLDLNGREKGLQAGANVVMPNLSPDFARKKYTLYDGKLCTGAEAAEQLEQLKQRVAAAGYRVVVGRGDCATYVARQAARGVV